MRIAQVSPGRPKPPGARDCRGRRSDQQRCDGRQHRRQNHPREVVGAGSPRDQRQATADQPAAGDRGAEKEQAGGAHGLAPEQLARGRARGGHIESDERREANRAAASSGEMTVSCSVYRRDDPARRTVIAGTGRSFELDFATTARWDGDLLVEEYVFWDPALMAQQIGLIDTRDVGAVAAKIAASPVAHADQTYRVTGPQLLS